MTAVAENEMMGVKRCGDATARVTRITDALNQQTRFTYDPANGNLLNTSDSLNHATAITYNQFGQPISVTDALNQITTFEYDEVGNLIATVDPLGNRTLRFYDAVSRLVAMVDARGKSTQFTYDNLSRVTQIQDAINGLTAFTYDPNGNLLTVTDAKNQVTTYTYDNMDRLATRKDALNRTERYQYDLAGNLMTFTDRKNQVTTFQYDALNRRISATYADATTTFVYDTVGRLVKASDTASGAGTIEFAYDVLDRLSQETTGQGVMAYQYDVLGRRTQMVANGQQPVAYQYDAASRLTRVAQGSLFAALGYDDANRRTSLGYSNNTTTSYAYDLASRLTSITHNGPSGVIDALTYTYDAAGNRISAARANGAASLLPNAVASAGYDAANEQTAFGGATLTYDANGNLTSDGVNTYQWDARNRLIGISGGTTASFAYDSLGRRSSKMVNGTSMQYAYDGHDITAEIGGGAIGASYLRSLNVDELFGFLRQDGAHFSIYDGIGSTLALTNQAGTPAVQYTYEPFGKTQSSNPAFANPFQFTGRENDGTGLYYYRARYLSTLLHRFIREDPFDGIPPNSQTVNLYSYVLNDPISYRDPSGQVAQVPPLLIAGAIFGGVGAATGAIAQGVPIFSAQFAALTTFGIANGVLAGAAASLGYPLPPAAFGAITSGLSNLIGQTLSGRKPVNIGSVVGAAAGGGLGAAVKAAIQAQLAGATTATGQTLPTAVTNALGAGLGLAPQVGLPAIGSAIGGFLGQP